jgi:hypothetical protein
VSGSELDEDTVVADDNSNTSRGLVKCDHAHNTLETLMPSILTECLIDVSTLEVPMCTLFLQQLHTPPLPHGSNRTEDRRQY